MNLRISRERAWFLLRIALPIAAVIILFFSGILPLENLFSVPTPNLSASVAAYDVASLTNEERIANNLPPLAVSPLLTQAAQLKADDMAKYSYYAHTGPDGKTMLDWMKQVGYHYLDAGENLVIDRTTAPQVIAAWMSSPDHRANILRPQFTQIGVGVAEGEYDGIRTIFVVQEFGTPYPTFATVAVPSTSVRNTPAVQPKLNVPSLPSVPSLSTISRLPAPAAPKAFAASSTDVNTAATTSPVVGQGTSSSSDPIAYTLAPEFYAPVTLTAHQNSQDAAQSVSPQGRSVSLFSLWIGQIRAYLSHIL